MGWAFLVQVGNIGANFEVIGEILDEVRTVSGYIAHIDNTASNDHGTAHR